MALSPFQFLTEDNFLKNLKASRSYTESLTEAFPEYERIAKNLPREDIDKAFPRTTEGTTASIIRKTPRRVVQQLPTGSVSNPEKDWISIVADFIYTSKIIPQSNEQYGLIQKCWSMVERSLTYGYCPIYTQFIERNGVFCTDWTLPAWGDVFVQPGKVSDQEADYIFMRSWWRTENIEALIERERQLKKEAKSRKENYESTWDLAALEKIKKEYTERNDKALKNKNASYKEELVEFVTGFQIGKQGKFYTFNPKTEEHLRTKVNKDPRGIKPINFMYGDVDGINPLGRGVVELVQSMQNLMDAELQMYQYNRAYNLNPAVIKRGQFNKNKIILQPNAIIDVGNDPNASVTPLTLDTQSLANFPNNLGMLKSHLLNLLSSPDTSISSEVGNPGFSKTPAGVKQLAANVSVDDNAVRKLFEQAWADMSETAINIYFGEKHGVEELQLDEATANKLKKLESFDPSLISDDNKLRIDWDEATPALKFDVDPSTSTLKDQQHQAEVATQLLELVGKNPQLNKKWGGPIDVEELSQRIVLASGIDDPEKVAPTLGEEEKAQMEQQQQMAMQQQQQANQPQQQVQPPKMMVNYKDAPEDIKRQMEQADGFQPSQMTSPVQQQIDQKQHQFNASNTPPVVNGQNQYSDEDQMLINELRKMGVDDRKIGQGLAMLHHKFPPQDILQALGLAQPQAQGVPAYA